MHNNHLWNRAKAVMIEKTDAIIGGFDIGFDDRIPEETKDFLMDFVYWAEDHFHFPVTLWVDFKYNHYLLNDDKKRVDHKFYWVDFKNYPVFTDPDDIPVIELPVLCPKENLLRSFIEGISRYYAWLTHDCVRGFQIDPKDADAILQAYLQDRDKDPCFTKI